MNRLLSFGVLGISVAALVVALLGRGSAEREPSVGATDESAPAPSSRAQDLADLESRLNSVEFSISSLMRRVEALEKAPVSGASGGEVASAQVERERAQLSSLRSDVDALLTGEALATDAGRQRFKEVLRQVQDEVFAERAQQRNAQRDQERADRFKKFAEEARLSSSQEQDLSKLLDEEAQARRALMEQRQPGQRPGPEFRQQLQAQRMHTDDSARQILNQDQFGLYQQMRQEDSRGQRQRRDGTSGEGGPSANRTP